MMISPLGKPQTTIIALLGAVAVLACLFLHFWIPAVVAGLVALCLLAFFRDPERTVPALRGQVVAPADGRISSIHTLDHYEPLGGPAVCIRIFLSVLAVHINRSPMHGRVTAITHKPGLYMNALRPESAEHNESVTIVLEHPTHRVPIGVVRQVAGAIARRIVCATAVGQILQRGERFGLIKFGSTTEVYLPHPAHVQIAVRQGQGVCGGSTVIANVTSLRDIAEPAHHPSPEVSVNPATTNVHPS
jgi:phosphatidylserine decarboxylase